MASRADPAPATPGLGLRAAFRAQRVALIGASERVHYHRALLRNLETFGFPLTQLALVNPNRASVFGQPCYATIADVPDAVDLAVIATPAASVPELVEACARRGVAATIVVSTGFGEAGPVGRRRQEALTRLAREHGIELIGPSSLGLVSLPNRLALFGAPLPPTLRPGNVSAVFQSGGMLNLFLGLLAHRRVGLASAVVTGNEAALSLAAMLESVLEQDETGLVVLYLESIQEPARFTRALERAEQLGKPIIALRAGLSARGQRNVQTHSGNLASSGRAWEALLRRRNVVLVENLDELLEASVLFSAAEQLGTRLQRPRALLMSVSGGDCTLLADLAERTGWELPDLPSAANAELAQIIGKDLLSDNPLDVGGLWRRGVFGSVANLVADRAEVDLIGFRLNLPSEPADELLAAYRDLVQACRRTGKLPLALTRASEPLAEHWYSFFADLGAPLLQEYQRGLRCARWLVDYHAAREGRPADQAAPDPPDAAERSLREWFRGLPPGPLSYAEATRLLGGFGLAFARGGLARTPAEASRLARELGFPVAVKADARRLTHRSDVGAVRLGLRDEQEVEAAFEAVVAAAGQASAETEGVIVQEMVDGLAEIMAGVQVDTQVGPIILLGLGGIFVELFQDLALRPAPLSAADVDGMLAELRSLPLLTGARGRPPADLAALRTALLGIARLAMVLGPLLSELDVNPLIVRPAGGGARAVDVVVVRAETRSLPEELP